MTSLSGRTTIGTAQERVFCINCGKYRVLTKKRACRVCKWRIKSICWTQEPRR